MAAVEVIQGEIFQDARGKISSLNSFRFPGVSRVYFLHHPDTSVVRGWNGHRLEKKWFYCVHGAFTLGLVEIDNWESPSRTLQPQLFNLTENDSRIVCVPEGYANCMRAEIPGSVLMVFSGKTLDEAMALSDSYRYDKNYWFNWDDIK